MESRRDVSLFTIWHQAMLIKKAGQILADVGSAPWLVWVPERGSLVITVEVETALDSVDDTKQFILAKLIWCFHVGAHGRECRESGAVGTDVAAC